MNSYFPSQIEPNNYNAVQNQLYKFQGSILEAEHPPLGDASNKVATTGWIKALMTGTDMWPITSDATNGTGLLVTISAGSVPRPNGSSCNVPASVTPIAVNSSSHEYVYIRYSDCQIVISTHVPPVNEGLVISLVETDPTKIIRITNYASYNEWAKLDSPFFTGDPKAPTPPLGDCDNSIATTQFVCDAVSAAIEEAFMDTELLGNPTAPTKELGDCSDSVATTAFVCDMITALLNNQAMGNFPKIVDAGGLNVNVTVGEVTKPNGDICTINPLSNPIGLTPNSIEYVYVRYVDCGVVVSTLNPDTNVGMLLGTAETDATKIINLTQMAGSLSGWVNNHFGVGFGGRLLPMI
jgi:hypothetical protein